MPNYGCYVPIEDQVEKSVIEPTQNIDRMQSADNVISELHKNSTVCKEKEEVMQKY